MRLFTKTNYNHFQLICLFCLSLLFTTSRAQGNNIAQGATKLNIDIKNGIVLDVLNTIKKATGVPIMYSPTFINDKEAVSISRKNVTVDEVLKILFKNKNIEWIYGEDVLILRPRKGLGDQQVSNSLEQDSTIIQSIKGKITDEQGSPIAAATILVNGTMKGATTGPKGEFTLANISTNAILTIRSIGYQEKTILASSINNSTLTLIQGVTNIESVEVVSTGYQDIPKERAIGSFVKIDNKTLNQQTGTNILDRLRNVTSGLLYNVDKISNNPNNKTKITIRGLSTINGPLDPLVVLDDFVYEGNIENINPNDVESVTVLKDASATSIYGARGGNGVIVITTKKSRLNQKPTINFSSNVIIGEKPNLFELPQISSSDYVDLEQFLFNQGYLLSDTSSTYHPSFTPAYEVFLKRRNGLISASDSTTQIDALKGIDSRNEYKKHFYRPSVIQQYSLNIRGGGSNLAWLISGAYDRSTSNLSAKSDRLNLRFYNDYRPTKNLSLTVGVNFTNSNATSGKPDYNTIEINNKSVPYLKFADENGTPLPIANILRDSYTDTAGAGKLLNWKYYPLEDYKHNVSSIKTEDLVANIGLNYKIIRGLSVDLKYQIERQTTEQEDYRDMQSYATRDLINTFSQVDWATKTVKHIIPLGDIVDDNNSKRYSQNGRAQLTYNLQTANHEVNAIAGGEIREIKNDGITYRTYGYSADPLTSGRVDFVNSYPTFVTGSPTTITGFPRYTSKNNRFVAMFANVGYRWKGRYSATASVRKDGSNIFGANTNDKWKPLWSTGVGWELSNESYYHLPLLPYLKIRGTYGYSGNVDLSKTAQPVAGTSIDGVTGLPYARISVINNPNLRWEQTGQLNIAADFAFKGKRISGTVEYYRKKSTDLYGPSYYDYTTWGGGQTITKNTANILATGADIQLNTVNTKGQIIWTSNLLLNVYRDKTLSYDSKDAIGLTGIMASGQGIFPVIGKPLYAIAAYRWGGLDAQGNPQGYADGKKSTDYDAIYTESFVTGKNIKYIGTSNPTIYGSLQNSASWKGFTVQANVTYKFLYYGTKPSLSYEALITNGTGHSEYAERWQQAGDEKTTNVPSFIYPTNFLRELLYTTSEINTFKADHIRLSYVNVSYTIDKLSNNSAHINDVQFYFNAANLGVLWRANKHGIDPDFAYSVSSPKTYTFGIRASFK